MKSSRWFPWRIIPNRDELTPTSYNLSQKIEDEQRLLKSFYEASVTLKPKLDRNRTIKKKCKPIFLINLDAKILHQNINKQNPKYMKRIIVHDQVRFIQGTQHLKNNLV